MEYVDLQQIRNVYYSGYSLHNRAVLTVLELFALGTEMSRGCGDTFWDFSNICAQFCASSACPATLQAAKEQKFNVLTGRECRSQGLRRLSIRSSTGNVISRFASSASDNFQTISLLSLPCLYISSEVLVNKYYLHLRLSAGIARTL